MEKREQEIKKKINIGPAWITFFAALILAVITFIIAPIFLSAVLFLALYLPVLIYILIYKWVKRWFVALVFSFSLWLNVLIILIPLLGGLLAVDLMNFSKEFAESPKYLVINDEKPIFGLSLSSLDVSQKSGQGQQETVEFLTKEELSDFDKELNSKVKDKVIFLVDDEVFRNVDEIELADLNMKISKDELFEILKSDNPESLLNRKVSEKTNGIIPPELINSLSGEINNKNNIKLGVLLLLVKEAVEEGGPDYIIEELKDNNIKIYPKRTSVNLMIKLLPSNILSSVLPTAGLTGIEEFSSSEREFNQKEKDLKNIRNNFL